MMVRGMGKRQCLAIIPLTIIPLTKSSRRSEMKDFDGLQFRDATWPAATEEIRPRISRMARIRKDGFPIRFVPRTLLQSGLDPTSIRSNPTQSDLIRLIKKFLCKMKKCDEPSRVETPKRPMLPLAMTGIEWRGVSAWFDQSLTQV
jgi:hypothetical protein